MSDDRPDLVPFSSATDPGALDDLRRRLLATRWPDAPEDAGWSMGADVDELRELVSYWADGFDWPAREAELNRLPRYRTEVGGLGIHLVHAPAVRPVGPAVPILLAHGWPDSFWRYSKLVPLLTDPGAHGGDPADAFDVVVPDMPGYGYSDTPPRPLDSIAVAALWAELMTTLGYERFVTSGGDIGSHVSRYLALDFPERTVAVHRMDGGVPPAGLDRAGLTPEELAWVDAGRDWSAAEGAYAAMHSTKPQTAGIGLTDSPAGLAAWIGEKLRSWTDGGEEGRSTLDRDDWLTDLSIYWFTGTIASSMRMYRANASIDPAQRLRRVETPSGFSLFAGDISHAPRAWLERSANLVHLTEHDRGGHFAPIEQPELYARELRDFFRPFRASFAG